MPHHTAPGTAGLHQGVGVQRIDHPVRGRQAHGRTCSARSDVGKLPCTRSAICVDHPLPHAHRVGDPRHERRDALPADVRPAFRGQVRMRADVGDMHLAADRSGASASPSRAAARVRFFWVPTGVRAWLADAYVCAARAMICCIWAGTAWSIGRQVRDRVVDVDRDADVHTRTSIAARSSQRPSSDSAIPSRASSRSPAGW